MRRFIPVRRLVPVLTVLAVLGALALRAEAATIRYTFVISGTMILPFNGGNVGPATGNLVLEVPGAGLYTPTFPYMAYVPYAPAKLAFFSAYTAGGKGFAAQASGTVIDPSNPGIYAAFVGSNSGATVDGGVPWSRIFFDLRIQNYAGPVGSASIPANIVNRAAVRILTPTVNGTFSMYTPVASLPVNSFQGQEVNRELVPEPSTAALACLGLLTLGGYAARRQARRRTTRA